MVEVIPLGGLGEFGMNSMVVACGDTAIVIDAGVMFPEADLPGVDLILPDWTAVQARHPGRLSALVLTHGHEDHVGGLAHVLPFVDGPIYGTPLTLALAEPKLEEEARGRLRPVQAGETVSVGPFRVEFLRVTHSVPDSVALAVETPVGTLVHTGDYKFDHTPLDGEGTDFHRLAALGARGVLALFGDSTNVDRRGVTGSERDVMDAFEEIFTATVGKIVVGLFASSIYRMQILIDLAEQFDRKVALVGRGVVENAQIAMRLGRLRVPPGVLIRDADVRQYPSQDVVCLCTGSQGEPLAALPRIAIDDHRHVKLEPGDVVVFSAREIPGHEKAIARVMNHVARRGADIVYEGVKHVHVSGHASAEELKMMLALVRPRYVVPLHGEYRQLAGHARLAKQAIPTAEVLVVEDGDVLQFDDRGARVSGRVPAGRVLIDGARTGEVVGEVADEVLRDRRHLAADGLVVPVLAINGQSGALVEPPDLITRGLAADPRIEALLEEAPTLLAEVVGSAHPEERTDPGLLRERVRGEVQRLFRKRTGRRPLVVPVVMEV